MLLMTFHSKFKADAVTNSVLIQFITIHLLQIFVYTMTTWFTKFCSHKFAYYSWEQNEFASNLLHKWKLNNETGFCIQVGVVTKSAQVQMIIVPGA